MKQIFAESFWNAEEISLNLLTSTGEQNNLNFLVQVGLMVDPRCPARPGGPPGCTPRFLRLSRVRCCGRRRLLQPETLQNSLLEPGQHRFPGELLFPSAGLGQNVDPQRDQDEGSRRHHDTSFLWRSIAPELQTLLCNFPYSHTYLFGCAAIWVWLESVLPTPKWEDSKEWPWRSWCCIICFTQCRGNVWIFYFLDFEFCFWTWTLEQGWRSEPLAHAVHVHYWCTLSLVLAWRGFHST